MKYLRLFKTEAEYLAANKELPNVSYVKDTGNVYYNEKHAIDRSINAPLMNMMYGLGLAENQDYMTYEEAARVSSLNASDFATYEVVSAWELKYFTGLVIFPLFNAGTYSLQELYIPDHIATIGSSGLNKLMLNKLHLPEALTALPNYGLGVASNVQDSILYIGANIASDASDTTNANGWGTIICMSPAFTWSRRPSNITTTIYVKDEYVNDYKAVVPWNTWGTVKPLSEYTGDIDY